MIHFLDANALVKRYIREPGTEVVGSVQSSTALAFVGADDALLGAAKALGFKVLRVG